MLIRLGRARKSVRHAEGDHAHADAGTRSICARGLEIASPLEAKLIHSVLASVDVSVRRSGNARDSSSERLCWVKCWRMSLSALIRRLVKSAKLKFA